MVEIEIDVEMPDEKWDSIMDEVEEELLKYEGPITSAVHRRIWSQVQSRVLASHYGRPGKVVRRSNVSMLTLLSDQPPLRARFKFKNLRDAALFKLRFG